MQKMTFNFDFSELNLSTAQIENAIGYKEGEDRAIVTDLIDEILKESKEVCNIKCEYNIFNHLKFNDAEKSLLINGIKFQVHKIIYGQIKKSDSIAVFLCTAGEEIGIRSRKAMQEKDLLKGYIYDIVGSEIVEAAADLMQDELEYYVNLSGKKITNRYSPGYCNWDVAEQHNLFMLVPDNACGIRLTVSALMDPVKSVSGFIGIGTNVRHNPYTCNLCDMKDCIYRRSREKNQ